MTRLRTPAGRFAAGTSRDAQILVAAVQIASDHGIRMVTRARLAQEAGLSPGTVSNYGIDRPYDDRSPRIGVVERVRADVMRYAIDNGVLTILAEGIAAADPIALTAPPDLQARALASLLHG
jgi:hypothetical protein